METIRLNKFIAHSAGLSRREADAAIAAGRVKVNGAVAALGRQIEPSDRVIFDGRPLVHKTAYTYVLLNKPVGYVCSRKSQGAPTIYELLPPVYASLKSVGRLDRDSSGLLLLTDDGDFTQRMTHPSYVKTKTYHVTLDHALAPLHQQIISEYGVTLDDGQSKFSISNIVDSRPFSDHERLQKPHGSRVSNTQRLTPHRYEVTMHEGRNRQIRRTFAALGYTVVGLHRVSFGPYRLTDENPGEFHIISV